MKIWRRIALALGVVMVSILPTGTPSLGAQEGTLTQDSGPILWSGGPFDMSYPLFCTSRYDPFCDVFDLTAELPLRTVIQVAVAADREGEEYRFSVHGPDGSMVAQSAWGDAVAVNFHHRPFVTEGPYEVRIQPLNVETGSTYQGMIQVSPTLADPKTDCSELVPDDIGVRGVTDDGSVLPLRVYVLVDQLDSRNRIRTIPEETYRTIFEEAEYSFDPLGIDLEVTFEEVLFAVESPAGATDTSALFAMAREHFEDGVRPEGSDVVYVLTQKNLMAGGSTTVAGQASCIGGIEDPRQAFALGEYHQSGAPGGLIRFNMFASAKIAAHEIGHLLGAHHHYANCAESLAEELPEGVGLCTLMAPDLTLLTRKIGVTNSAIIRENVHAHAGHDH